MNTPHQLDNHYNRMYEIIKDDCIVAKNIKKFQQLQSSVVVNDFEDLEDIDDLEDFLNNI
jgi:hypothetical protein